MTVRYFLDAYKPDTYFSIFVNGYKNLIAEGTVAELRRKLNEYVLDCCQVGDFALNLGNRNVLSIVDELDI